MAERIVCNQCGRERPEKDFFMTREHTRFPVCKSCLTMYIKNDEPETFKWILEKFDVPYIEKVWKDEAQKAYDKNPLSFGSASVLGRYLRMMNMTQYLKYNYSDTVKLALLEEERTKKSLEKQAAVNSEEAQQEFMELQTKLDAGEISQAEFNTMNPLSRGIDHTEKEYTFSDTSAEKAKEEREKEILNALTADEKIEMATKWGDNYKPSQWLSMEQMYHDYEQTFDLNVDSKAVVRQICQVYLKMNEALTVGDTNAYKSFSSTYDSLRKSANLTKAQNKENQQKDFDSIGQLVFLVEKKGGIIPNIPNPDDYPQDKIDFCIKDMKQYNYNLVTKELGLGNLIESYIDKLEQQQQEQQQKDNILDDDFILSQADEAEANCLTDQEAEEFSRYLENEIEEEAMRLAGEIE